ncbi:MAG TPA: hypothetical protein VK477_01410 [Acidobacteriota bacterium]|nr:hypothetical protein [Acidobacteriota bacterium]
MRFLFLAVAFALSFASASAVYYGQSRAEVIQELGKPASDLKRGAREVLIYKAGRIELEDGKLTVVQGIAVAEGPGVTREKLVEAAASEAKIEPTESPLEAKEPAKAPSAAKESAKSVEQQMIEADVAARAKMEKDIEALENPPPHEHLEAGPPRWLTFVVELIIKAIMMLAALWLTTKYWSVEISWFGLAMAAVADTVTRAAVGAVALWALNMGTTMYADEATAAIVLVVVLRKVSYNQSLSQAVTITLTSKTFSIVVGSFLSVFLMHTLFGGGGGGLMPF